MDSSKEELKARNTELQKLEEKKTEEEKKRIDYKLKREEETLAQRTRIKVILIFCYFIQLSSY